MGPWAGIQRWFGSASIASVGAATLLYSAPLLAGVWMSSPARAPIAAAEVPAPRARFVPLVVELEPEEEPPEPLPVAEPHEPPHEV
ncbi:MAG: hypothetical protein ABMA64_33660, partial [Myxococcota bacterium]